MFGVNKGSKRYMQVMKNLQAKASLIFSPNQHLHITYDKSLTCPLFLKKVVLFLNFFFLSLLSCSQQDSLKCFIWSVDNLKSSHVDSTKKGVYIRPDFWWNKIDGIKAGLHFTAFFTTPLNNLNAAIYYNTGTGNDISDISNRLKSHDIISYLLNYKANISMYDKIYMLEMGLYHIDGLDHYKAVLSREMPVGNFQLYLGFQTMLRDRETDLDYLLLPEYWGSGLPFESSVNCIAETGIRKKYDKGKNVWDFSVFFRTSVASQKFDYSYSGLMIIGQSPFSKTLLRSRFFLQYGMGKAWAKESALYLCGGNPFDMMSNAFTRAVGFIPSQWLGYGLGINHFHYSGGLNLRGYSAYMASDVDKNGETVPVFLGKTGAAINFELEFDRIFNPEELKTGKYFTIDTYLFTDMGVINQNGTEKNLVPAAFRMDAGIGMVMNIKQWGSFDRIKPLTVRLDLPLFLNRPPAITPEYFKFRWIAGVNRAF